MKVKTMKKTTLIALVFVVNILVSCGSFGEAMLMGLAGQSVPYSNSYYSGYSSGYTSVSSPPTPQEYLRQNPINSTIDWNTVNSVNYNVGTYSGGYVPSYSTGSSPGYGSSGGGSVNSGTSSGTRQKKTCSLCNGSGRTTDTKGVASFGQDKWCQECGRKVSASHYHTTCPSCKGQGMW